MSTAYSPAQDRDERVEAMIEDLLIHIPDHRREHIPSLAENGYKRVETMLADFLGLVPDLRRDYIESLTDLLCTHKHLYPTRHRELGIRTDTSTDGIDARFM